MRSLNLFESTTVKQRIPLAHSRQWRMRVQCTAGAGMYAQQRAAAVQLALTSKGCTTVSVTAAGASACAHPRCSYSCAPASVTCLADALLSTNPCKLTTFESASVICPSAVGNLQSARHCPEHTAAQSRAVLWQCLQEELRFTASSTAAYPCWSIQGLAGAALRLRVSGQPDLYSDCSRPAAKHVQCCLVTTVSHQGRY